MPKGHLPRGCLSREGVCIGGVYPGRCLPEDVYPGGVCPGCPPRGCLPSRWYLPRGFVCPGVSVQRVFGWGCLPREVSTWGCLPRGVSVQVGVCLGGACPGMGYLPGRGSAQGDLTWGCLPWGMSARGGCLPGVYTSPTVDRILDTRL